VGIGPVALLAGVAVSATAYPVVAHVADMPVRAPTNHNAWGACPSKAVALDRAGLIGAKRAVLAALPTIAKEVRPPLDTRAARVIGVSHTRKTGFIMPSRQSCQGVPFTRSALVKVTLPAEKLASLRGNPWFYVARTKGAWVIWDRPR
jgi:hypothetical protein